MTQAIRIHMGGPTSLPTGGFASAGLASVSMAARGSRPGVSPHPGVTFPSLVAPSPTAAAGMTYSDYVVPTSVTTLSGLQSFLASVPNGSDATHHSRMVLQSRAYTGASGLSVSGRQYLTIDGGGSRLAYVHGTASGGVFGGGQVLVTGTGGPVVSIASSHHVTFSAMTVSGSNPDGASTFAFHGGAQYESQAGFRLGSGVHDVTFDHVNVHDVYSDNWAFRGSEGSHTLSNILITGCRADRCGRMGLALFDVDGVEVVDTYIGDTALIPIDFEPNNTSCIIDHINIHHCTFGAHGWATNYDVDQQFVSSGGSASNGWQLRTFTLSDIRQIGPNRSISGSQMTHMAMWFRETAITGPITITGCQAYATVSGGSRAPVFFLTSVNTASVTNNHGHLAPGGGATFVNGSGNVAHLTASGND